MPDNPDITTLIARGKATRAAQDKLRATMAAVAAEAKQPAPAQPATGGSR
jgi:hypothetical protein